MYVLLFLFFIILISKRTFLHYYYLRKLILHQSPSFKSYFPLYAYIRSIEICVFLLLENILIVRSWIHLITYTNYHIRKIKEDNIYVYNMNIFNSKKKMQSRTRREKVKKKEKKYVCVREFLYIEE